jgi:O-antigen ligase
MKFKSFFAYLIFGLIGVIIGFRILPEIVLVSIIILFSLFILWQFSKKEVIYPISNLTYLFLIEPFVRVYLPLLPYLFLQYFMIILLIVYQFNKEHKNKTLFIWLVFFLIVILFELLNTARTLDIRFTRSVILNSLTLLCFIILGTQVNLNIDNLKKLFKNLSYAGFMLTGIVAVAHFQGNINYSLASNFESSNGMAPVQLSFYLSFTLVVTYLYYLKFDNNSNRIMYYAIIAIQSTIMILTFSRGGLYFFILIFALINFESLIKSKISLSYVLGLFLLVPIGLYIYNYTLSVTEGAVAERYADEGTSNRDVLVEVGIEIFKDNPLFGIGTGNFNLVAMDTKYFGSISGAHNEFVRILAEHGFFGFSFYILFFLTLFYHILKYRRIIPFVLIPIIMILAFNFGAIHNGLKLSLQSFTIFIAIAYSNSFIVNSK